MARLQKRCVDIHSFVAVIGLAIIGLGTWVQMVMSVRSVVSTALLA